MGGELCFASAMGRMVDLLQGSFGRRQVEEPWLTFYVGNIHMVDLVRSAEGGCCEYGLGVAAREIVLVGAAACRGSYVGCSGVRRNDLASLNGFSGEPWLYRGTY